MSVQDGMDRGSRAILTALGTALAGALPATALYDLVSRWLRPINSGEDVMGHALDVFLIGGPASTLALAAVAGVLSYRSRSSNAARNSWIFIGACAVASLAVIFGTPLLR